MTNETIGFGLRLSKTATPTPTPELPELRGRTEVVPPEPANPPEWTIRIHVACPACHVALEVTQGFTVENEFRGMERSVVRDASGLIEKIIDAPRSP